MVFVIETRVAPGQADNILPRLGFTDWVTTHTAGMMGGIWMLWDDEETEVEILSLNDQAIHARISRREHASWVLSGIYAQPRDEDKQRLFNHLDRLLQPSRNLGLLLGTLMKLDLRTRSEVGM